MPGGAVICGFMFNFIRSTYVYLPQITTVFTRIFSISKAEALKRWDHYGKIGSWKNETFRPLIFPDPEKAPNARPRLGQLPNFMQTIQPYNDWKSGNVAIATLDGSFIQDGKRKDLIV